VVERIQKNAALGWSMGSPIVELEDPDSRWLSWQTWVGQTDVPLPPSDKRIIVNDHGLALHMALAGNGVVLAWLGVVDELLRGQSLIRLSQQVLTSKAGYWLVGPVGFFRHPTRPVGFGEPRERQSGVANRRN